MKIVLSRSAWDAIRYWTDRAKDYEVSGLGNALVSADGEVIYVTSVCLPTQKGKPAESEMSGDGIAEALYALREAPGETRFHWHSHVQMPAFWSATDHAALRQLGDEGGWFAAMVLNQKGETLGAYTQGGPVRVLLPDVPVEVETALDPSVEAALAAEFDARVTPPPERGGRGRSVVSLWDWDDWDAEGFSAKPKTQAKKPTKKKVRRRKARP